LALLGKSLVVRTSRCSPITRKQALFFESSASLTVFHSLSLNDVMVLWSTTSHSASITPSILADVGAIVGSGVVISFPADLGLEQVRTYKKKV
jgi:hypothetical protein